MSVNLLGLFFDAEYYTHTSCPNEECNISTALTHYQEQGIDQCAPPNEYFFNNPHLLHQNAIPEEQCIISDWLTKSLTLNVEHHEDIIKSYVNHTSKDSLKRASLTKFIYNYLADSASELEVLFGKANLDIQLIIAFNKKTDHQLSEQSINYLEKLFAEQAIGPITKQLIPSIILNYATYFASDESPANFLSEVMNKDQDFIKIFLAATRAKENLATKALQRADYLLAALSSTISYYLTTSTTNLTLVEETIFDVLNKGHLFPLKLVDNLIVYYQDQTTALVSFLKTQSSLTTTATYQDQVLPQLTIILEKIVEYYPSLPQYLADDLVPVLLKLINIAVESSLIKKIIFIIERLFDHHLDLPSDTLSYFSRFVTSDDRTIQRLTLKLYCKLTTKLAIDNVDLLLSLSDFDSKIAVFIILAHADSNNLTDPQKQLFDILKNELETTLEQDRAFRTSTNILVELRAKLLTSWSNEQELILKLQFDRLLTVADWPVALLSTITSQQNDSTIKTFTRVIQRISNYAMSYRLIDRSGTNIVEILTEQEQSKWLPAIKKLYNDNNFSVDKTHSQLIQELAELGSNPDILQLIKDGYFHKTHAAIKQTEQRWRYNTHQVELSYDQPPASALLQKNKVYCYSQNQQVIFVIGENNLTLLIDENSPAELISLQQVLLAQQPIHPNNTKYMAKQLYAAGYWDINSWQPQDFLDWKATINNVTDHNIVEVLAILKQVAFNTVFGKKYYPRDAQIITVLCAFKATNGRLLQVETGGGKSVIIDMFATIKVLSGHNPDILTSSEGLAKRDVDDQRAFYNALAIRVAHPYNERGNKPKDCYKAEVIYGDPLTLIGDDLRDIEDGTRNGRGYDAIIVDEVDNLFIDSNSMMVKLSDTTPGFFHLKQILIYMWGTYPTILDHGVKQCPATSDQASLEQCNDYLKELLRGFVHENLLDDADGRDQQAVSLPRQLEKFAKAQTPYWVDSLMSALFFKQGIEYSVVGSFSGDLSDVNTIRRVSTVDFKNTGTVNPSMQWTNGLYQFLSLKENTRLTSEDLVGVFKSYVGYFNKFIGNIYGFTGTLGTKTHTDFLSKFYGVDTAIIPTFKPKKLVVFPEVIVDNKELWQAGIINVIKARAIDDDRAVLVIMYTIEDVDELYNLLKDNKDLRLIKNTHGSETERKSVENGNIGKNTVIIATNLAGRGSDIKITKEVEINGGLHVIVTFFPDSIRTLDQAFGRAARKGESGSAQLIIINNFNPQCNDDLVCLEYYRNQGEINNFKYNTICAVREVMIQDWLFAKFHGLLMKLDPPSGYNIVINTTPVFAAKQLYLTASSNGIYLAGALPNNMRLELKIDHELAKLDQNITGHIYKVLTDKNNIATLNKQDLELIHFIAARNGLTTREIILQINKVYQKCFSQEVYMGDTWECKTVFSNNQLSIINNALASSDRNNFYLYALWKRYLELYDNRAEIVQIKATWKMWFYHQQPLLEAFIKECNENDPQGALLLEQALRDKLSSLFNEFANKIKTNYGSVKLFDNPRYLVDKAYHYNEIFYSALDRLIHGRPIKDIDDGDEVETHYDLGFLNQQNDHVLFLPGGGLLHQALYCIDQAINLDDQLAWPAYQARVIIRLIIAQELDNIVWENKRNSEKCIKIREQTLNDLANVIERIDKDLARFDGAFAALAIQKLLHPKQELMAQYVIQRQLLVSFRNKEFEAYQKANSTKPNQILRMDGTLNVYDLAQQINETEASDNAIKNIPQLAALLNSTNSTNIGQNLLFIKNNQILTLATNEIVEAYNFVPVILIAQDLVEEEQDWAGTIFSAVFGALQIFASFAVIAIGGPFATSLGLSMLMRGITDLASAGISVIEGKAIDFNQYFGSLALHYAIAVITAGVMQVAEKTLTMTNSAGNVVPLSEITSKSQLFLHGLKFQAVNVVVGTVAGYAAKRYVKANSGDAQKQAEEAASEIVAQYSLQLAAIFIADGINHKQELKDNLFKGADKAAQSCQNRFHDVPSTLGAATFAATAGLTGNIYGTIATTAVAATLAGIKYGEFTTEFEGKYGNKIVELAENAARSIGNTGSEQLMRMRLEKQFRKEEQVNKIMDSFAEDQTIGFVDRNRNIDYRNCGKISNYKQSAFPVSLDGIKAICDDIFKEYESYKENLRKYLANLLLQHMTHTLQHDLTAPLLSSVLNNVGAHAYEKLEKSLKERETVKNPVQKTESQSEPRLSQTSGSGRGDTQPASTPNSDPSGRCPGDGPGVCTVGNTNNEHTINPGDTLTSIAKERGTTVEALIALNPELAPNPDLVLPGKKIIYPQVVNQQPIYGPPPPIPSEADKFFAAVKELAKAAEVEKNQCPPIPKQSHKHGWIGEAFDSAAAWYDDKKDAAVDAFFEASYELAKSVAQNDNLYENTIIFPEYKPEYSQGIRNVVNEGFQVIGIVTNEALKSAYSSRPTDVFLDSAELREQIVQRRDEYDQVVSYLGQKLNEHTTYGERRLVGLGLTFVGIGKIAYDTVKYGELFGARHIQNQKFFTKVEPHVHNEKLKIGDYGKKFELPPYGYKEHVLLFKTKEGKAPDFVRVFNDNPALELQGKASYRDGAWLILRDDFNYDVRYGIMRGWNNNQITDYVVNKYGIPNTPTKIVDSKLPGEVLMAVGKANKIEFNGKQLTGGGRQYQILQEPKDAWFPEHTVRGLNEYIKSINAAKK